MLTDVEDLHDSGFSALKRMPSVSYVLLTYNQENYVEEALSSALAQEYRNLEIIVSDDCSSDSTWAIIEQVLEKHSYPGKIKANRNEKNQGIGRHLRMVAALASGEIVVLAAGDDISRPERTADLVESFSASDSIMAVFSNYEEIDETGSLLGRSGTWKDGPVVSTEKIVYSCGGVGKGATYAYRRRCFFFPTDYPEHIQCEDRILPFRAAILGKVVYVDRVLVRYRKLATSLTAKLRGQRKLVQHSPGHIEYLRFELRQSKLKNFLCETKFEYLDNMLLKGLRRAYLWRFSWLLEEIPVMGRYLSTVFRYFMFRLMRRS